MPTSIEIIDQFLRSGQPVVISCKYEWADAKAFFESIAEQLEDCGLDCTFDQKARTVTIHKSSFA